MQLNADVDVLQRNAMRCTDLPEVGHARMASEHLDAGIPKQLPVMQSWLLTTQCVQPDQAGRAPSRLVGM